MPVVTIVLLQLMPMQLLMVMTDWHFVTLDTFLNAQNKNSDYWQLHRA